MLKMDPVIEQSGGVVVKGGLLVSAWVFAQLEPMAEFGMEKAYDMGFSVFLLFIFLIYMVYENRNTNKKKDNIQAQNNKLQTDNKEILVHNIEAIINFAGAVKDMAKSQERSAITYQESQKEVILAFKDTVDKLSSTIEKKL